MKTLLGMLAGMTVVILGLACGGDSTGVPPAKAFGLSIRGPFAQEGIVGHKLDSLLVLRAYDDHGFPLPNVEVTFSVEVDGGTIYPKTLRTNPDGDAIATWTLGTKAGQYIATATTDGQSPVSFFAVADPGSLVGPWELTAYTAELIPGRAFQPHIRGFDKYGNTVSSASAAWRSSNDAVATVAADGLIRGITTGTASIIATFYGTESQPVNIKVDPLEWTQIHADGTGSSVCGTVASGEAFCWGEASNVRSYPQFVPDTTYYSDVTSSCGLSTSGNLHCGIGLSLHGGGVPATPLPSAASFSVLSNRLSTCALTSTGVAFCFGDNTWGQLGNGVAGPASTAPTTVAGTLNFTSISASGTHVCGIATSGKAYCWGKNDFGQLGTASTACGAAGIFDACAVPVPVAGDISFKTISAGVRYSCGVATDGTGYCWGDSTYVPWRDGLTAKNPAPSAVQGGYVFNDISVASSHACGLTTDGAAICWGQNTEGALGRGTATISITPGWPPAPVDGGLTFSSISVGAQFSCAITPQRAAYCWGDNTVGELGNGKSASVTPTEINRSVTPVLVPRVYQ
jgi:hypothetical protein